MGVFLVYVVWRKDLTRSPKSGKWFPYINVENSYWTVLVNYLKSYKIGVRDIGFLQNDELMYKEYGLSNYNTV